MHYAIRIGRHDYGTPMRYLAGMQPAISAIAYRHQRVMRHASLVVLQEHMRRWRR